jgi:hypothetical protein
LTDHVLFRRNSFFEGSSEVYRLKVYEDGVLRIFLPKDGGVTAS